jgi:putative hydrolase of the HAD superfamily
MTSSPKAIFFDMDGTILDWTTGMEESWLESCERHHDPAWPHTPSQLHEAIRARRLWFWNDAERATRGRMDLDGASREIVRHAFEDLGIGESDLAHRLADFYRALRFTRIFPYPGAIETLQAFLSRGVRMALLTNGEARNQRRAVERHGLERYFDCIVIEGEFGCGKPDERVFRHALETVACDPDAVWMVGDSLEADIAGAHPLGIHTIWVDELGDGVPDHAPVRPHRVVRSIAELVE